jgi:hypothetical protein
MAIHLILNVSLICAVAFILLIWFESDIVQTLTKLTYTRKLFKIPEFEKYKLEEDVMSNYANFLYTKYPGYLTKLISCPICLCFWITLLSCSLIINYLGYPTYYTFLLLPVNYMFSLYLYLKVKTLL